jgi:hypothetical protein
VCVLLRQLWIMRFDQGVSSVEERFTHSRSDRLFIAKELNDSKYKQIIDCIGNMRTIFMRVVRYAHLFGIVLRYVVWCWCITTRNSLVGFLVNITDHS